jgi:hypothetical protein
MPRTVFIKKSFFNGQREITLIFQTGPVEYQRFQSHFVLKELLSSFKINTTEKEKNWMILKIWLQRSIMVLFMVQLI